eukprot:CAMPEP_0179934024 /NCGR_PEP_ID=MMETSP0983-20121128/12206_1 /TAXON_ID=483367 /ORGANISM="non described non described, Strain CCMP 2436" /LENGTH=188 /DNA_ID=CAMNT_0021838919 /DNA_START=717 /DNA_END=1283 /DNA_ORIENTATION=+
MSSLDTYRNFATPPPNRLRLAAVCSADDTAAHGGDNSGPGERSAVKPYMCEDASELAGCPLELTGGVGGAGVEANADDCRSGGRACERTGEAAACLVRGRRGAERVRGSARRLKNTGPREHDAGRGEAEQRPHCAAHGRLHAVQQGGEANHLDHGSALGGRCGGPARGKPPARHRLYLAEHRAPSAEQ